jgi:hypothetical protein
VAWGLERKHPRPPEHLLANIQWRQDCAAAIGLGFTLPANSQESVMDKFGQVFGAEELEAVSVSVSVSV